MKQLHFDLSRRSFSEGGSVMKHSAFTSYDERMKNESFRLQIRNGNDKLRADEVGAYRCNFADHRSVFLSIFSPKLLEIALQSSYFMYKGE